MVNLVLSFRCPEMSSECTVVPQGRVQKWGPSLSIQKAEELMVQGIKIDLISSASNLEVMRPSLLKADYSRGWNFS